MKQKVKLTKVKSGTILVIKPRVCLFKRLFAKLFKHTTNNMSYIIALNDLLLPNNIKHIKFYEPVKRYTRQEMHKLTTLVGPNDDFTNFEDVQSIINLVRPNTFAASDLSVEGSKYYKLVKPHVQASCRA